MIFALEPHSTDSGPCAAVRVWQRWMKLAEALRQHPAGLKCSRDRVGARTTTDRLTMSYLPAKWIHPRFAADLPFYAMSTRRTRRYM